MLNRDQLPWMVYGAYGVTGRLIVGEALRRGHRPVLAGRDAKRLQTMAWSLGLDAVVVALDDVQGLHAALNRARLVVHAVGPYSETGKPMLQACLATQTPYVDIAGEISHLKVVEGLGGRACQAGVPSGRAAPNRSRVRSYLWRLSRAARCRSVARRHLLAAFDRR